MLNFNSLLSYSYYAHTTHTLFTPSDGPNIIPSLSNLKLQAQQRNSNMSDDEPLYDAVASDDDYAAVTPIAQQVTLAFREFKMNSIG